MNKSVDIVPSNNVPWNGPNIPCLGLCKGDTVSDIVVKLATKICELAEPYDVSTLTLECALEMFDSTEPLNRTINSVLQLMINNECSLKDLIDNLQAQLLGLSNNEFIVDLKCLAEVDGYGNPLPYTEETVIQGLINEICSMKNTVSFLAGQYTEMQNQIDNLNMEPLIDEKDIATCINPSVLPTSTQVKNTSNALCDYIQTVGDDTAIAVALAKIPSNWNTQFQAVPGWIINPVNFMEQMNNVFLALASSLSRIEEIENNCCTPSCELVKLGFSLQEADGEVIIRFRDLDGTYIPLGWVHESNVMTITDPETNQTTSFSVGTIVQGFQTAPISLSGFKLGNDLIFTLQVTFKNGTTLCSKMSNEKWRYISDNCCVITNVGSGNGTITYQI